MAIFQPYTIRFNRLFGAGLLLIISLFCQAQTNYYSTGDGDMDEHGVWTPSDPPDPLPSGDSAFVRHTMSLAADYDIDGVLVIESSGTIDGTRKLKPGVGGVLINYGSINITNEVHVDGSWYNYNYAEALKVHNDGYICNSDTIEIDSNEKLDNHGGVLECGGLFIVCEVKMHENGGTDPRIQNQDLCCDNGTDPVMDLQEGTLDSVTVSYCGTLLPVELVDFYVENLALGNKLWWQTSYEHNFDGFQIQRNFDQQAGRAWESIGFIKGLGTPSGFQSYQFLDREPLSGLNVYRLKQIDLDGKVSFSPMVEVYDISRRHFSAYPNRTHGQITIESSGIKSIEILNTLGKRMVYLELKDPVIDLNISSFPPGNYFIKGENEDFQQVMKLIKY